MDQTQSFQLANDNVAMVNKHWVYMLQQLNTTQHI